MPYKQIKANTLLKKIETKDKLFCGYYTVDPYQNCEFRCSYCDSSFDKTIYIKINAAEVFSKEIEGIKKGRIVVGSVHDPYQKAEKEWKLTKSLLEIIKDEDFSCHILTKSDLVLRDIDIISKIPDCYVTISIISLNKLIYKLFEENVPDPKIRLQIIEKLRNSGVKTGLALIPILPFIVEEELENIVRLSREYGAEYLLYKHLELKGDQKYCFLNLINKINADLPKRYDKLYKDSFMPNKEYLSNLNKTVSELCKKNRIKNKI